jgi:hypothetical protein
MIDLADEFSAAVCSLSPARIDVLRVAGIHERAIFHEPLMVGMAPIQTHQGGLFDLADAGDLAVLLPCGEWDGLNWCLHDICAFHLDQPERWWRRRGDADVLGIVNGLSVEPRRLHRHPLNWLRDAGRGLVVLDWAADPVDLLMGAGQLAADHTLLSKLRKTAIKAATAHVNRMFCHG